MNNRFRTELPHNMFLSRVWSLWDTYDICSQGTILLSTLVGNIVLDLFDFR